MTKKEKEEMLKSSTGDDTKQTRKASDPDVSRDLLYPHSIVLTFFQVSGARRVQVCDHRRGPPPSLPHISTQWSPRHQEEHRSCGPGLCIRRRKSHCPCTEAQRWHHQRAFQPHLPEPFVPLQVGPGRIRPQVSREGRRDARRQGQSQSLHEAWLLLDEEDKAEPGPVLPDSA
jgi:hypothetical protein